MITRRVSVPSSRGQKPRILSICVLNLAAACCILYCRSTFFVVPGSAAAANGRSVKKCQRLARPSDPEAKYRDSGRAGVQFRVLNETGFEFWRDIYHSKRPGHQCIPTFLNDWFMKPDEMLGQLLRRAPELIRFCYSKFDPRGCLGYIIVPHNKKPNFDDIVSTTDASGRRDIANQYGASFISWYIHPSVAAGNHLRNASGRPVVLDMTMQNDRDSVDSRLTAMETASGGSRGSGPREGTPEQLHILNVSELDLVGPLYLATALDLTRDDVDMLKRWRADVYNYLEDVLGFRRGEDVVQMYFHCPYTEATITLHLHIRVGNYTRPLPEERKSIDLDELIAYFEDTSTQANTNMYNFVEMRGLIRESRGELFERAGIPFLPEVAEAVQKSIDIGVVYTQGNYTDPQATQLKQEEIDALQDSAALLHQIVTGAIRSSRKVFDTGLSEEIPYPYALLYDTYNGKLCNIVLGAKRVSIGCALIVHEVADQLDNIDIIDQQLFDELMAVLQMVPRDLNVFIKTCDDMLADLDSRVQKWTERQLRSIDVATVSLFVSALAVWQTDMGMILKELSERVQQMQRSRMSVEQIRNNLAYGSEKVSQVQTLDKRVASIIVRLLRLAEATFNEVADDCDIFLKRQKL